MQGKNKQRNVKAVGMTLQADNRPAGDRGCGYCWGDGDRKDGG